MTPFKTFIDYSRTFDLPLYGMNIFLLPGSIYTDIDMVYYAMKPCIFNLLHTMRFWNNLHRVLAKS
jgi:hypothetical protein